MLVTIGFIFRFFYSVRRTNRLQNSHVVPWSTLIAAVVLTIGLCASVGYLGAFKVAFQGGFSLRVVINSELPTRINSDCDAVAGLTAENAQQLWLDLSTDSVLIVFACITLYYTLQRRHFGALNSTLDHFLRQWVNAVLFIAWVDVVVFKSYLGQKVWVFAS